MIIVQVYMKFPFAFQMKSDIFSDIVNILIYTIKELVFKFHAIIFPDWFFNLCKTLFINSVINQIIR